MVDTKIIESVRTKWNLPYERNKSTNCEYAYAIFKGLVPMCYLLEINHPPLPDDFDYSTPERFAKAIKWAQDNGAHILGPSIAGAHNN